MTEARPFTIFTIIFTVIALAAVIVINYAASGPGVDWGIFKNSTDIVSDKYSTRVTPAGYTFLIWTVIYVAQALWVVYAHTLLCRKSDDGYLYYSPDIMPLSLYIVYWFNLACNVTWLFMWDRELMIVALVLIALIFVSLFVCIVLSVYYLNKNVEALVEQSKKLDIWLVRLLVQQSLALYATWVFIATHINLAIVLIYEAGMSIENGSRVAVSMLAFFIIIYFILDIFVLDKYLRYLITPYLVLVWALIGVIVKNWNKDEVSSIMIVVLLVVGGVVTLAKITVTIFRTWKYPDPPGKTNPLKYKGVHSITAL